MRRSCDSRRAETSTVRRGSRCRRLPRGRLVQERHELRAAAVATAQLDASQAAEVGDGRDVAAHASRPPRLHPAASEARACAQCQPAAGAAHVVGAAPDAGDVATGADRCAAPGSPASRATRRRRRTSSAGAARGPPRSSRGCRRACRRGRSCRREACRRATSRALVVQECCASAGAARCRRRPSPRSPCRARGWRRRRRRCSRTRSAVPSGDQAGAESYAPVTSNSAINPLPSAFSLKIARSVSPAWERMPAYTTRLPSGAQLGYSAG